MKRLRFCREADDVVVLCYHAISRDWDAPLAVTQEQLDAELALLKGRGYRAVTFAEALKGGGGRRVAVTFDDAYRSVTRLARPVLESHGMNATVFAPTDYIGTETPMSWPGIDCWLDGPHAEELIPMSWEEMEELAGLGWEIGSHTCSHPQLTLADDASLHAELVNSRVECERRLGRPCESLAFPYGAADRRVADAARAAGYVAAAALTPPVGPPTRYRWPRVGVYRVDNELSFRLKLSRPVRRLQRSRGWALIEVSVRAFRPSSPPST